MNKKNIVGVLGGMGPYATLKFMELLLKLTPAPKDWDHLHIILDNNVDIPSRSRYILYGEASPVPQMINACQYLSCYPVDFIVIPCNSASYFIPEIQPYVKCPIVNIIDVTVKAITKRFGEGIRVAVWGGAITYLKRSYAPFLEAQDSILVEHGESEQKTIESFIEKLKHNESVDIISEMQLFASEYQKKYPVDVLILGCTEFGLLEQIDNFPMPIVDSNKELACYTVQYGGNQ